LRARLRILALAATLALVGSVPASGQTSLAPGGTFLDDDFRAAEPAIEALVAAGITNGCAVELFCPLATVSRGQMATFLGRALKAGTSEVGAFTDLVAGSYYAGFVNRLAELGVVDGYPDGTFRPDAPVSRAEMAALLVRAVGLEVADSLAATPFTDVPTDVWYHDRLCRRPILS
jgi:hypothetical protein